MSKSYKQIALAVLALGLPAAALADINGTITLANNERFNFDTGAKVTSAGDALWASGNFTPQGLAKAATNPAFSGQATYDSLSQSTLSALFLAFPPTSAAIPSSSLAVGAIVGIQTNAGHIAKMLVTANSGGSITFLFTTFGVTGGGGPTITKVQNNYSYILQGLPNYGIAPGTLFIIVGTGLAAPGTQATLWNLSSGPLPTTSTGTSITAVVGTTTVHPGIYYTSETQVAAVLPSNTPVGTGTITVTYNNQTSAAFTLVVVQSALGLDSLYGTGTGIGVATDNSTGAVFGYTNSAKIGQAVVFWGSGTGADTSNDDLTFPAKQNNLTGIPFRLLIGGVEANVLYRGRSQYPGVDQINAVIPSGIQLGCFVSVIGISGNVVTNVVTLPITQNGGTCSDPALGLTGDQLATFGSQANFNVGSLFLAKTTSTSSAALSGFSSLDPKATTTENFASGSFFNVQGAQYGSGYGLASIGSCIVEAPLPQGSTSPFKSTGLDAGTIMLSGPVPPAVTLSTIPTFKGIYSAQLSAGFIPDAGGTFTFTGSGGADVGPFTAPIDFTNPLTWTNMEVAQSITRSSGVTVKWTGGAQGTYVQITGSSSSGTLSVSFVCEAPVSALQFTVPPEILLALPVSNDGSLALFNTAFRSFTASGLTFAQVLAGVQSSSDAVYK